MVYRSRMVSPQWTYELTKKHSCGHHKIHKQSIFMKTSWWSSFLHTHTHTIGLTFFNCNVNRDTYLKILNAFVNHLTDEDQITACFHSKMDKITLRLSGLWDYVVLHAAAALKRDYPPTWLQCHTAKGITEESVKWKPQYIYIYMSQNFTYEMQEQGKLKAFLDIRLSQKKKNL